MHCPNLLGRSDTLTQTLRGGGGCSGGDCTSVLIHVGENGLEDGEVHSLCAAESGKLKPDDEDGLEGKVPGEIVKDETEGEAFQKVEEAKYDPVRQPLDIILVTSGFNCLERQEGG